MIYSRNLSCQEWWGNCKETQRKYREETEGRTAGEEGFAKGATAPAYRDHNGKQFTQA